MIWFTFQVIWKTIFALTQLNIYLSRFIYVFYSGVTLSRYCRASVGVVGILAGLQDCQCSSREGVNCYHSMFRALLIRSAPVCCKSSECVQNTPFGMLLDGASLAARFEFVHLFKKLILMSIKLIITVKVKIEHTNQIPAHHHHTIITTKGRTNCFNIFNLPKF